MEDSVEDSGEDSVEAGPVGGRRYAIQCTALEKGCNSAYDIGIFLAQGGPSILGGGKVRVLET